MMHIALSTRILAPLRGAGMPGLPLQEEASHSPVPRCVFGFQPPRLHGLCLRPYLGIIENAPGAEGPLSRRFGDWGLWLCGRANPLMRERAGLLMLRISPIYHTCPAF